MKIAFLILLTLCTIELSLRIKSNNEFNFGVNLKKSDSYKVLFIGDSILSEIPERLNERLQKYSTRKYIVNKIAIPSAKIANIYRNLDSYLSEHQPDLVITLLGKTDIQEAQSNHINTKERLQFEFKILKILNYYIDEYIQSARELISKLISPNQDNFQMLTKQAEIYFKENKFSLATPLLMKAIKLDDQDVSTYLALAYSLQKQTKFEEALNWCHKANKLEPNTPKVIDGIISIYLDAGMKREHQEYIDRLKNIGVGKFQISNALGNFYLKYKEYLKAQEQFQTCLKLDESKSIIHLNLGRSLMHQGKNVESLHSFMNAVRTGINNDENHLTLILHGLEMGFSIELDKFYSKELLIKYPKEKRLLAPMARIAIDLKDYKRSLHYLVKALNFDPSIEATQKTADLLASRQPSYSEAINKHRKNENLNYSEVLIKTYPLLANKILNKNTQLFIMQYPEKELKSLSALSFKNKNKITFIDSKKLFSIYQGNEDLFQNDKAHLTTIGSNIIAKEIEVLIQKTRH